LVIERNGSLVSVTPYDLQENDKIIRSENAKYDLFAVKDLGYRDLDVYDIETEKTHNFFANNILVHNSEYIAVDDFCKKYIGEDLWEVHTIDEKIDVIDKISDYIKDYVNHRTFNEVQKVTYNSMVDDFHIKFAKEKIAISGLFVKKKKYATRSLWIEGVRKEKISVTGLDVVRSDSSEAVRGRLKDIMSMILKDEKDDAISEKINQYKNELMDVYPEEIAANIGVKGLKKYIVDGKPKKGTPWHVKGAANYMMMIKELGLEGKYEEITEGAKCKVLYLKNNPYNIEAISFIRWPEEFNGVLQPDYQKMIDKFFVNKIEMLLKPTGNTDILNKSGNDMVGLFFT
jgi:DNA polymerase elongation subunit (family B)